MKTSFNENPSIGNETIQIISLNNGAILKQPKLIPKPTRHRQLERLLKGGVGKLPGLPGFTAAVAVQNGAATVGVRRRNEDVLTCGIALQPNEAHDLWVWMIDFRAYLLGRDAAAGDFARFSRPVEFPWMAQLVHPDSPPISAHEREKLDAFLVEITHVLAHAVAMNRHYKGGRCE